MGVRRVRGGKRAFAPGLEIGIANQTFQENMKSAS